MMLSSQADIAIMGGAAGGGKTFALVIQPLIHIVHPPGGVKGFGAVLFRRTFPEIVREGGMWDESERWYPALGATPNRSGMFWTFPGGQCVSFAHLQHEKDIYSWQGAQVPLIIFDEITHFTEKQFWYLVSRNRSVCGVRPYIRGACNPDPDSWVYGMISWWIDPNTGFPIEERSGVIRWFVRYDDKIQWADDPQELRNRFPGLEVKSFTFIPATVFDNQILMEADPGYLANLQSLPRLEKARLLEGNWLITAADGEWPAEYFPSSMWFEDWPRDLNVKVISLDPSKGKDSKFGDYAAFIMMGRTNDGMLWVEADLVRRPTPQLVDIGLEWDKAFWPDAFAVEANVFQELLLNDFIREGKAKGKDGYRIPPCHGWENFIAKEVRIRRLGPLLSHKLIRFRKTLGTELLVRQLKEFPNGEFDDGPDALELACRQLQLLLTGVAN